MRMPWQVPTVTESVTQPNLKEPNLINLMGFSESKFESMIDHQMIDDQMRRAKLPGNTFLKKSYVILKFSLSSP